MRLYLIISLAILLSTQAYAVPEHTDQEVPSNLHVYSASNMVFVDMPAKGCSGERYVLFTSHPMFDKIFSMLLAAQMSNKKVVLRFDGCNHNNQGQIIGVYLK